MGKIARLPCKGLRKGLRNRKNVAEHLSGDGLND